MTADTAPVGVMFYARKSSAVRRARQLAARHGRAFIVETDGSYVRPWAVHTGPRPLWPGGRWITVRPPATPDTRAAAAALADDDHDER